MKKPDAFDKMLLEKNIITKEEFENNKIKPKEIKCDKCGKNLDNYIFLFKNGIHYLCLSCFEKHIKEIIDKRRE